MLFVEDVVDVSVEIEMDVLIGYLDGSTVWNESHGDQRALQPNMFESKKGGKRREERKAEKGTCGQG